MPLGHSFWGGVDMLLRDNLEGLLEPHSALSSSTQIRHWLMFHPLVALGIISKLGSNNVYLMSMRVLEGSS
jgi:hypothetical protein